MQDIQPALDDTRSNDAGLEAWRLEVDQIIAAIHPRPAQPDCDQTLAVMEAPEAADESGSFELARTQPALPRAETLGAPAAARAYADPSEAATSPAHPVAVESLRAACLDDPGEAAATSEPSEDTGMALVRKVADAATEVHQILGPGLEEQAYQHALAHELSLRGIHAEVDVPVSASYKGRLLPETFLVPLIVEGALLVDVRGVERLEAQHEARLRTYLVLSQARLGLLVNFHEPDLSQGLRSLGGR